MSITRAQSDNGEFGELQMDANRRLKVAMLPVQGEVSSAGGRDLRISQSGELLVTRGN
jgi:hypothetical protein